MERNAPLWVSTGSPRGLHRPFSDSLSRHFNKSTQTHEVCGAPHGPVGTSRTSGMARVVAFR
jgi:hypothetical protein